jgi:hypothetical protein
MSTGPEDADPSDLLREAGWRQGSCLERDGQFMLLISQDCDIVKTAIVEPDVEVMDLVAVTKLNGNYQYGRHPRVLHVEITGLGAFEARIRARRTVAKTEVVEADQVGELDRSTTRLVITWVAKRYTRPAFPDSFNERLRSVGKALGKWSKSADAKPLSKVYFQLDPRYDELREGDSYDLRVVATMFDEDFDDEEKFLQGSRAQERLEEILEDCPGIDLVDGVELRPHRDVSLTDLETYHPYDFDHRSVAGDDPVQLV